VGDLRALTFGHIYIFVPMNEFKDKKVRDVRAACMLSKGLKRDKRLLWDTKRVYIFSHYPEIRRLVSRGRLCPMTISSAQRPSRKCVGGNN
jgi:hypothetical protein